MSSTGDPEPVSAEDRAYFRALEESFLQLRGRATLLGPEDFRIAQTWRHAGIPLEVVLRVMSDLFTRQRMRKSRRGISSLRYFRAAVDAAWHERLELDAGGSVLSEPDPGPPVDLRLRRLANAIPGGLTGNLRDRLVALDGDFEQIEAELARLDAELLAEAGAALDDETRTELDGRAGRAVARLGSSLPDAEREEVRRRLWVQILRDRCGLPLLSLFSPQALEEDSTDEG